MTILLNILGFLLPTFVLAGSIAAGTDDSPHHRRVFMLVYGLWLLTLAMWNWMRSTHIAWVIVWAVFGAIALLTLVRRPAKVD